MVSRNERSSAGPKDQAGSDIGADSSSVLYDGQRMFVSVLVARACATCVGILDHRAAGVSASYRISLACGNATHHDIQEHGARGRRVERGMVKRR